MSRRRGRTKHIPNRYARRSKGNTGQGLMTHPRVFGGKVLVSRETVARILAALEKLKD